MHVTTVAATSKGTKSIHAIGDSVMVFNPFMRYIFFAIFELPLLQLYLYGPAFAGHGFWQGQEIPVICASITNVPSHHWVMNADECSTLIYKRFESYMVLIYVALYMSVLLTMYGCVMWHAVTCTCCRRICQCRCRQK